MTGVHENREQNAQSLADNGLKFRFLKSRKHVSALRIVERFARDVPLPDSDNQGKNRDKNSGCANPVGQGILLIAVASIIGVVGTILFYRPQTIFCLLGLLSVCLILVSFILAQYALDLLHG